MPTVLCQSKQAHVLRVNCPDWYDRPDFQNYLNSRIPVASGDSRTYRCASWHKPGDIPHEMSDCFIPFDHDAPESGVLPDDISDSLLSLWKQTFGNSSDDQYGIIWLSNLKM